jgi:hypothetical protein
VPDQELRPSPGDVIQAVEERLANATSPREMMAWLQIRGELLRQNEYSREQEHRRRIEKISLFARLGFAGLAFSVGTGLFIAGFPWGGIILGAGLVGFIPEYERVLRSLLGRGSD